MTPRPLTDSQIAAGLRAHLPVASAGLRDRILTEIMATPQERRLPSFLGRLTDADPIARRRMMLLVALVALAVTIAVVAVGALLREQRNPDDLVLDSPIPDLSIAAPADVDAFVLESYGRLVELPALKLIYRADDRPITTVYYDGEGVLREEAGSASISTSDFSALEQSIGGRPIWVIQDAEGIDPIWRLVGPIGQIGSGCPTDWEYLELAYILERPTHHVRCVTEDPQVVGTLERHLWIDIDLGLALRGAIPGVLQTESGSLVPAPITFNEVIELEVAPQPDEVFVVDGETMPYEQWTCEVDGWCESLPPPASNP